MADEEKIAQYSQNGKPIGSEQSNTADISNEEFDIGMTDEELLGVYELWKRDSEDYYSTMRQIWEQNIQYYKANQTRVGQIVGKQSKAVENRIFMGVETMIPIATASLPDVVAHSGSIDEVDQMNAQDLQDVLNSHMQRVDIQALSERFLRDMVVKRYGVFKILWDENEDDVGISVIDPRRIRIPRYGKNLQECIYLIENLEMNYPEMVEFFGEEIANDVRAAGPQPSSNTVIDGAIKGRKNDYLVDEVWTNDFVAWVIPNKVLKKQKNPFFNWKSPKKNYFKQARKPYIVKSLFETEESIIGDTDLVQQVIPIQDNINTRKRQIEDITNQVADPILAIDSSVMSEEEVSEITNEAGFILYGPGAANEGLVRFHSPGTVPQYLFADLETSRASFDNIWGMHASTRGENEGGRETLGGRRLLRQGDLGRIDGIARQLERALGGVAEWWTQLIKLFYTGKKTFTIIGQDGMRFIKEFSAENIGEGVKIIVTTGSTLPKDEVMIREDAKTLWQLQAIGVKTLYKMLKLPDQAKAFDDYIKTKSGEYLRSQSPATPIVEANPPSPAQTPIAPETVGLLEAAKVGGAQASATPVQ